MRSFRPGILIVVSVILSLSAGCARQPRSEKVVATVNDYSMSVEDFNYESKEIFRMGKVIGDTPNTKEDILDALIVKQILLQEAQRQDLDKDKEFMRSIELYWEQTLLKNLLRGKYAELHKKTTVFEEEIVEHYNLLAPEERRPMSEMRDSIVREIRSGKEKKLLDEWIGQMRLKSRIRINRGVLNEL
ncbi:MAG: hypothetical protein ISS26_01230 [Candidatus Omnitrophica bacterium]|nr:hypothetical protein [Candidatus Omnitrophota bacterium]